MAKFLDPLSDLLKRGEDLARRLDHRRVLLAEMRELGGQPPRRKPS